MRFLLAVLLFVVFVGFLTFGRFLAVLQRLAAAAVPSNWTGQMPAFRRGEIPLGVAVCIGLLTSLVLPLHAVVESLIAGGRVP